MYISDFLEERGEAKKRQKLLFFFELIINGDGNAWKKQTQFGLLVEVEMETFYESF